MELTAGELARRSGPPAMHERIREAYGKEPDLRRGSAVDDALLGYLRKAWAHPSLQRQ